MSMFHHINMTSSEKEKNFFEYTPSFYFCMSLLFTYMSHDDSSTPQGNIQTDATIIFNTL